MKKNGFLSAILYRLNRTRKEGQSKLNIDYPQAGEKVHRGHYTVRISECAGECQIEINGTGVWHSCRRDWGYRWYDWNPTKTGENRISIRTRAGDKWIKSDRICRVV
jgi:hypothetical protein